MEHCWWKDGWVCEVPGGAPGKKRQNTQRLSPLQGLLQASAQPSSKSVNPGADPSVLGPEAYNI